MIRVLIADDHRVLLGGIENLIEQEEGMEVVGKAHHGDEVLAKLMKAETDLILLDINMPGKSGMDICENILAMKPDTRILVMSMHQDPFHVNSMLKKGAHGYITKNSTHEEMLEAIRKVASGENYFSNEAARAIEAGVNEENSKSEEESFHLRLSRREKEVLQLIVEEHTTQEIADQLSISMKTVETHRRNLLSKLNARNTAGLVRIAIERRLV